MSMTTTYGLKLYLASALCRAEFEEEARTVACLKNVNIVGLVGVCYDHEPLYVVLEYMKHGDLWQFLQTRVAAESSLGRTLSTTGGHRKTLRYTYNLYNSVK